MTTNSLRIYVYKITFYEVPHYYYGVHKEKFFNEYYMGSPVTHKDFWRLYTPKKEIIKTFDYTHDGWILAQKFEKKLIKPVYNKDPFCLNENCGGAISLKILKEAAKMGGDKAYELRIGVFAQSKEKMTENSKKAGKKSHEMGVGVHGLPKEKKIEIGKRSREFKTGLFGRSEEKRKEDSKKAGKKSHEMGVGVHSLTKEQLSENGKRGGKSAASQRWQCTVTRHITSPGALTKYQNARGIDPSNRRRVDDMKNWKITFECGKTVIVECLITWANQNGYKYHNLSNVRSGKTLRHRDIIKIEPCDSNSEESSF